MNLSLGIKRLYEMNIYETFNNLRYHYENEVVELKKAENSFDANNMATIRTIVEKLK